LIGPFIIAIDRWEMMQREKFSLSENVAREGIPLAFNERQTTQFLCVTKKLC